MCFAQKLTNLAQLPNAVSKTDSSVIVCTKLNDFNVIQEMSLFGSRQHIPLTPFAINMQHSRNFTSSIGQCCGKGFNVRNQICRVYDSSFIWRGVIAIVLGGVTNVPGCQTMITVDETRNTYISCPSDQINNLLTLTPRSTRWLLSEMCYPLGLIHSYEVSREIHGTNAYSIVRKRQGLVHMHDRNRLDTVEEIVRYPVHEYWRQLPRFHTMIRSSVVGWGPCEYPRSICERWQRPSDEQTLQAELVP